MDPESRFKVGDRLWVPRCLGSGFCFPEEVTVTAIMADKGKVYYRTDPVQLGTWIRENAFYTEESSCELECSFRNLI